MPRGRPKLVVNLNEVRELASEGNTMADIANALGFARSTFFNRKDIKQAYEQGIADLRVSLRHWQVNAAKSGNVQMLIWLGKNLLKQKDCPEDEPVEKVVQSDELSKSLRELAEKLESDK